MRLKHIKLVGFKSFVDPTTIPLPTNLTAVVGPNGCGKSNIIDAIRWVMGESSAKQLRGESLGDVIFNGAATRKPVGQAAIELMFDNSDQKLTGQYASYGEIAVRREITRDGQSTYFLNNTRCRRRDITDLFLGTGLGPRSYAIIEQGMISRLIEAKPEDLRNYIEEAAGISKYKERRHETELRIGHTNENLARLNDIREELSKQLNHLQRQANAAERYTVLKQEERLLKAQIHALRWRHLDEQVITVRSNIQQQEIDLARLVESHQELESNLEQRRKQQSIIIAENNEVQAQYYQSAGEVSRLEQAIQNQQERRSQWQQEYDSIAERQQSIQQQLITVTQQANQLLDEVKLITPDCENAKAVLEQSLQVLAKAETEVQEWQARWDTFNQQKAQAEQRVEVEQTRIHHLEQRLQTGQQRVDRLQGEHSQQELALDQNPLEDFDLRLVELQAERTKLDEELQTALQAITTVRQHNQQTNQQLDTAKTKVQTLRGQQTSLESLQTVALGQREEAAVAWLQKYELADLPRFAQVLQVEPGWEQAVEIVLERYLQAVCVDDFASFVANLKELPQANISVIAKTMSSGSNTTNATSLLSKIKAPASLANMIAGIYIAETLQDAWHLIANLAPHESVVTRDGVWLNANWLCIAHKADANTGILQRERELLTLREELQHAMSAVTTLQETIENNHQELHTLEEQREVLQAKIADLVALQADVRSKQQIQQAQITQLQQRAQQIHTELTDCRQQVQNDQAALASAKQTWQAAQDYLQQQIAEKELLLQLKTDCQISLETVRKKAQTDRDCAHQRELSLQAARMQLDAAEQNKMHFQQQLQELAEREAFLQKALADSAAPLNELKEKIEEFCDQKNKLEQQLAQVKQNVVQTEQELTIFEQQRQQVDRDLLAKRSSLEQARLTAEGDMVRAKNLEEQVMESGYEIAAVLTELPEDAAEPAWEEKLSQVIRKIERLGPINLAAIDEHAVQAERKEYLDKQYADLTDALTALQDAMQKMDRETKTRFKETYEMINGNFQRLFPTLFGGGNASLHLNEDDLLTAGVTVMAQPPGKRNSSIHLLSGGEKALTAISLVFSLFQLNPAPFCVLDEVDAPLDDANVGRFCNLVKQMAKDVQFIFISHNKLAIEMAEQLAGVTMQEAGVSRMVAVNIEEAIAMAEA